MKKLFIIFTFVFALLLNCQSFAGTTTTEATTTPIPATITPSKAVKENISQVVHAISLYKKKNYLQCIADLNEYVKKYPKSAAAHYYLGSAYMRLGLLEDAKEHYTTAAEINTVLQLTSYSLQAIECINSESQEPCVYYALSKKQIAELVQDPTTFLTTMKTTPQGEELVEGADPEIDKLIKGQYPENLHPDAVTLLRNERDKQKQYNINKKAMVPGAQYVAKAHPVHSFAPSSNSTSISQDEMQLIIMSETAALKK